MPETDNPYVDEHGHCMFAAASDAYDCWLAGIPYVGREDDGTVTSSARSELLTEAWPTVERLCIRLEAGHRGDLAARVERSFRDVGDYARLIDGYCLSDRFDYGLWAYGDPVAGDLADAEGDLPTLLTKAREIGESDLTEDLHYTAYERAWAQGIGDHCGRMEIEKYGRLPTDDYPERIEMRAWACFWLAAQLRRRGVRHKDAFGHLEAYLSGTPVPCPSEAKHLVIHEALGRGYGMRIYPIAPMESEEVSRALGGFFTILRETQIALSVQEDATDGDDQQDPLAGALPVTLIEFMQQYCHEGEELPKGILDSRRNSLQSAAHAGTIRLPDHVGEWKSGKPKFYPPAELASCWPGYCRHLPNLPPLADGIPSAGRQSG